MLVRRLIELTIERDPRLALAPRVERPRLDDVDLAMRRASRSVAASSSRPAFSSLEQALEAVRPLGVGDVAGERGDRASHGFEAWSRRGCRTALGDLRSRHRHADRRRMAGAGPHFGREAVFRFFEQLRDTWDTGEMEAINLIDAGDRVIARVPVDGRRSWPGRKHRRHERPDVSQGQGRHDRVLLGLRRSPRSRGAVGARRSRRLLSLRTSPLLVDVAGVLLTAPRQTP